MNEQDVFLRAIAEDPDDDGLRLIFADWLEDHGKGYWAHFIRAQLASRRDPDGLDLAWPTLTGGPFLGFFGGPAVDLEQLNADMAYPVPFTRTQLARGLVGLLTLDAGEFLDIASALAAWGPLPYLELTNVSPHLEALSRCETLAGVTALKPSQLNDEGLRVLLESPHLGRLKELSLGTGYGAKPSTKNAVTADGARLLAHTRALPALERLHLDGTVMGDEGLIALGAGPALRQLTGLSLKWCGVTGPGLLPWADAAPWQRLQVLNLSSNPLSPDGAQALASSPQLATLWSLDLSNTNFTDGAARALGDSPHPRELRDLDLSSNALGDEGFIGLAESPALTELRRLKFRYLRARPGEHPRIGSRGGAALRNAPLAAKLRILDLCYQNVGDAGLVGLAESGRFVHLEELNLGGNDIGDAGAVALAGADHLQKLTRLGLYENAIGPAGARALAGWPGLTRLRSKSLHTNPFGPDGVELKLRIACKSLSSDGRDKVDLLLDLEALSLSDEGVARLTARPELGRCHHLNLMNNGITARGVRQIAECPAVRELQELNLSSNPIGAKGAVALADSPYLAGLRSLRLGVCELTDAGVVALAASPHLTGLRELAVYDNHLTNVAALALARAGWPHLEALHLSRTGLTCEALVELADRFGKKVKYY